MTLKATVTIQVTLLRDRDALFITNLLIMLLTFMSFTRLTTEAPSSSIAAIITSA